jgi:hypothetical protein
MTVADWVAPAAALVLAGVFGTTVGWTRPASPMLAVRTLLTLSFVITTSLTAMLVFLALPLLGRSDSLADQAHWDDAVFTRGSVSGLAVSVLAAITLAAAMVRVTAEVREQIRHRTGANRFRDVVGAVRGETIVAALDEPDAMALSSGVIVITPTLIRALGADERRAVLAHERAHVDHRHHRYRHAAALLAAANPLLRRIPDAIGYLTERWADEDAARATSRATTAKALQRVAGLTAPRLDQSLSTMHSAVIGVPERILALESGSQRVRWHRVLSPAVLVAGVVVVALAASERTLDLFQLAHALGSVARTH